MSAPAPKLTGRRRHRTQRLNWPKRDVLVLQVEVTGLVTRMIGRRVESDFETWWRDATAKDLTVEEAQP